jgi:hypothetical protein
MTFRQCQNREIDGQNRLASARHDTIMNGTLAPMGRI